jgi:putative hemolysin
MDVDVLLREMQTQKKSIAIVIDSFGGTSGIVSVEDILEEIVGEIDDEYDTEEPQDIEKIDDNTWIVNGFVEVDTLNDDFEMELPVGDYETIAGLVISHLAKIPTRGQTLKVGEYVFEILEVTNKKIKKIKIISSEE